jgi:DNA-binding transcriptional LysR family regulator
MIGAPHVVDEERRMLEVRQAAYFIAVAEELHFGRAAARLRMSQPPLSQAIKALECQVGAVLLERTNRSVVITEAGRQFLAMCYPLVAAAERAERAAATTSAGFRGVLRVAAVTSAFEEVLPDIIERFRAERPLVDLQVEEVDSRAGVDALLRAEVDVAIVRQPVGDRRLSVRPLRHDEFVAAVPVILLDQFVDDARLREPLELSRLRDAAWVWIPRRISPAYHDEIVTACRQAGFSPVVRHRALSIPSQRSMVACGLGVALMPRTSAEEHPRLAYLGLSDPVRLTELSLVVRAAAQEPLVRTFADCASESLIISLR